MTEGIESALFQLISKVEASQSLIDELELQVQQLKLQLDSKIEDCESTSLQLQKMQEELEYYFLMSQKQSEIIKASEELQARSISLLDRISR